tara:strand:- start:3637 stop:3939 length:303 start_codon:yes stop_codon:yes gene_type:complete
MTDLEIDKALALAIGWPRRTVLFYPDTTGCWVWTDGNWRIFSHLDWATIGPIAERYDCFPFRIRSKEDFGKWNVISGENDIMATSPQRAIALAVIQGAKK